MVSVFRGTNRKKSPGPDGIGPLAISYVYGWDTERITALIMAHIRLGVHPNRGKVARGVTIGYLSQARTTTTWPSLTAIFRCSTASEKWWRRWRH